MPQLVHQKLAHQRVLLGTMPSGTSRSSDMLSRVILGSFQELQEGVGPGSDLLLQAGIRTLEGFDFGYSGDSFFVPDIQELMYEEITPILAEINDLLTWPEGWNGYNAHAPNYGAIQYAHYWIKMLYREAMSLSLDWSEPNVTANAEGEVVFEWRHGVKNLTIYIGNQNVAYVKDWGADINTEMEDGYANSPIVRQELWKWLMG